MKRYPIVRTASVLLTTSMSVAMLVSTLPAMAASPVSSQLPSVTNLPSYPGAISVRPKTVYDIDQTGYLVFGSQRFTVVHTNITVPNFACSGFDQTASIWSAELVGYKDKKAAVVERAGVEAYCNPGPGVFGFFDSQRFLPKASEKGRDLKIKINPGDKIQLEVDYSPSKQIFAYHINDLTDKQKGGGTLACGTGGYCNREGAYAFEQRIIGSSGGYIPLVSDTFSFTGSTTSSSGSPQSFGSSNMIDKVDMRQTNKIIIFAPSKLSRNGKDFTIHRVFTM